MFCPDLSLKLLLRVVFLIVILLALAGLLVASAGRFLRQAGILTLKPAEGNGKMEGVEFVLLSSSGRIGFSCMKGVSS